MKRDERRIYQVGVAVAAVLIIAMTAVVTEECSAKTAAYADTETAGEEIPTETGESPEIGQIREHNASQRIQRVETLEGTDEQETSKKEVQETIWNDAGENGNGDHQSAQPGSNENIYGYGVEDRRSSDGGDPENDRDPEEPRLYMIAGDVIPEEIQTELRNALAAEGIEEWFSGALAQVYQESHGNPYAENPNGLDKGLLQYRITYWPATAAAYGEPGADIFDWRAQVRVYARQAAARINAGLSADEVISRHKTSDDCPALDPAYIQQVRQWLGQMEAAR